MSAHGRVAGILPALASPIAGIVKLLWSPGKAGGLPKGNYAELIAGIQRKLLVLPDETIVYSGHGPATTIGNERVNNPYL